VSVRRDEEGKAEASAEFAAQFLAAHGARGRCMR
jgi:hypothetical protein